MVGMDLAQLLSQLTQRPGPVLTWYGADRIELSGPVAARWLTKTANLLGTELAGGLFGGDPQPGTLLADVGRSWQAIVWAGAAHLSGWRVTTSIDEGDADVWVVHQVDARALEAARKGTWVLAQELAPLALSWRGEALTEGILDGLVEVAAQSDVLEVDVEGPTIIPDPQLVAPRVILEASSDAAGMARAVLAAWAGTASVVLVDPQLRSSGDLARIARLEHAQLIG